MIHFHINHWYGRFGNNIIAICNALDTARKMKGKLTYINHPVLKNKIFDFSISSIEKTFEENFYEFNEYFSKKLPIQELYSLVKAYVKDLVPRETITTANDELVIHIRSGDIFLPQYFQPQYIQPPITYYEKIIQSESFKNIFLVAEDNRNPVIDKLLCAYPGIKPIVGKQNNNTVLNFNSEFIHDLNILLSARTLVIGNGSLGFVVALLSDSLQHLYHVPPPPYESQWNVNLLKEVLPIKFTTLNEIKY